MVLGGLTTKEEKVEEGLYRGTVFLGRESGVLVFPSLEPVSGDAEPKVRYYGMTVCTSRSTTSFFLRIFLYVYGAQICSERTLKPSAYNFVFFFFLIPSRPSLASFQRFKWSIDSIFGAILFLQTPLIYVRI